MECAHARNAPSSLSRAHCCTEELLCGPWSSVYRIQDCGDAGASLWLLAGVFGGSYASLLEHERAVWLNGQQALILFCCMLLIWFFSHSVFFLSSRGFFWLSWVFFPCAIIIVVIAHNLGLIGHFSVVHHCGIGLFAGSLAGCTVIPGW